MKARVGRRPPGLATIALLLLVLAAPAAAQPPSAAQRLADRFAPIAMVREQQSPPCQTTAEQYQPTSVDAVLGNPAVKLVRDVPGVGLRTVKTAPSAADIARLGDGWYLDLPGNPLAPDSCGYARDFQKLVAEGRAPVVVYAHVAREQGRPGFALQYWFYWYFNQFNDLHEGDWEGMQLSFDEPSPAVALARGAQPKEIIVFQHAGGERAGWDDSKVRKDGTHPVVYPAAGSHATFYASTVYVENGARGAGLGCDNTSGPVRELRPRAVLLPDQITIDGPFKWMSYAGRWGQKEKSYNNGPTGPQTKTQWVQPFTWMEAQRTTSPRLPGGSIAGPQITSAFCGAVASVTSFLNRRDDSPASAYASLALVVGLFALFVGVTRWRPVDLDRLRAPRAFGQLVLTAARLYVRHWRVVVPLGLVAFPAVGAVSLLGDMVADNSHSEDVPTGSGLTIAFGDVIGDFGRPVVTGIVGALVIVFVRDLVTGDARAGVAASFRGLGRRFWRVVAVELLVLLGLVAMVMTIVGIPFAAWKYVGWQFARQQVLFEGSPVRGALRGSSDVVRGRWWHALRVTLFLAVTVTVVGPVLTFALIFTTLPLVWIDVIGALIFSLVLPYVMLAETLLWFDLRARAEAAAPARRRRALLLRRRRDAAAAAEAS
jgi:hypothetical protein